MQSPLVLASLLAGQTADCAALALCDWRITDTIARSRCNIIWTIIGARRAGTAAFWQLAQSTSSRRHRDYLHNAEQALEAHAERVEEMV